MKREERKEKWKQSSTYSSSINSKVRTLKKNGPRLPLYESTLDRHAGKKQSLSPEKCRTLKSRGLAPKKRGVGVWFYKGTLI